MVRGRGARPVVRVVVVVVVGQRQVRLTPMVRQRRVMRVVRVRVLREELGPAVDVPEPIGTVDRTGVGVGDLLLVH